LRTSYKFHTECLTHPSKDGGKIMKDKIQVCHF